jgi:hypothetical protein
VNYLVGARIIQTKWKNILAAFFPLATSQSVSVKMTGFVGGNTIDLVLLNGLEMGTNVETKVDCPRLVCHSEKVKQ